MKAMECFVSGKVYQDHARKPIGELFNELAASDTAYKFSSVNGQVLVQVDGLAQTLLR